MAKCNGQSRDRYERTVLIPVSQQHTATGASSTPVSPAIFFRGKRLLFTALVALAALAMVGLGFWQLSRRAQRLQRNAYITERQAERPVEIRGPVADPSALEYRRARVVGMFDYDNEIVQRNRARSGSPGVHVLTPLRIEGSDHAILVDRGWIPFLQMEQAQRRPLRGPEQVEVEGMIRPSQSQPPRMAPVDPPLGPERSRLDAWFWVDVPRIQQQTPYPLLPLYIEWAPQPGAPSLPWRSQDLALNEGPHLSYAIQWFSFAAILASGYIVFVVRSQQPGRSSPSLPPAFSRPASEGE